MKKMSFMDIKNARKWALPTGILVVGLVSIVGGQAGTGAKSSVRNVSTTTGQTGSSEAPAPTVKPTITINGTEVATDKNGTSAVNVPGGRAQVEVSNGRTRVTTNENASGSASNTQSGNVEVNINSHTNGGAAWGYTQVNGFSSNSGNSNMSSDSTTIFSTDSNNHTTVSP